MKYFIELLLITIETHISWKHNATKYITIGWLYLREIFWKHSVVNVPKGFFKNDLSFEETRRMFSTIFQFV